MKQAKRVEDLLWKNKSGERKKFLMLFGIRIVENFTASFIPSLLGLIIVYINPSGRIMAAMKFVSFIAFCVVNWFFWMRYAKQRTRRYEFYIMNGLTYLIYAGISVAIFLLPFTGKLIYSVFFSNLRAFEIFGLSTKRSLMYTHIVMLGMMIICEIFSRIYYKALLKKLAENGADEIEMEMWKDKVPHKKDGNVRFLSVEEMSREMEKEHIEAWELLKNQATEEYDGICDVNMTKGRGQEVFKVELEDPDNDIDKGDFIPDARTQNANSAYGADSLWNKEIYKNRTENGIPIEDYGEEAEELPSFFDVPEDSQQSEYDVDNGTLWNADMRQGRGGSKVKSKPKIDDETVTSILDNTPYDADNLWSKSFYKGRGEKDTAEDKTDEYSLNDFEAYDSDSLWDNITQGKNK